MKKRLITRFKSLKTLKPMKLEKVFIIQKKQSFGYELNGLAKLRFFQKEKFFFLTLNNLTRMKEANSQKSKPFPWTKLSFEEVSELRNLNCPDYAKCLNYAANRYWESWVCLFCSKFNRPKKKE